MRSLGVIPARGGSKGVPRKNIKKLGGQPLIAYTIAAAMASNLDEVIVSTEDDEIAEVANNLIALHDGLGYTLSRPTRLAQDDTLIEEVLLDMLSLVDPFDVIALLNPTSPFRDARDINNCLIMVEHYDSVVSVTLANRFLWRDDKPLFNLKHRPRRQDAVPILCENGAIYMTGADRFQQEGTLTGGVVKLYEMPPERSFDIDTELDFTICEAVLNGQHSIISPPY